MAMHYWSCPVMCAVKVSLLEKEQGTPVTLVEMQNLPGQFSGKIHGLLEAEGIISFSLATFGRGQAYFSFEDVYITNKQKLTTNRELCLNQNVNFDAVRLEGCIHEHPNMHLVANCVWLGKKPNNPAQTATRDHAKANSVLMCCKEPAGTASNAFLQQFQRLESTTSLQAVGPIVYEGGETFYGQVLLFTHTSLDDGIIRFTCRKQHCLAYFLLDNVYVDRKQKALDLSRMQHVYVNFQATLLNQAKPENHYVATCVWLTTKPKNPGPAIIKDYSRAKYFLKNVHLTAREAPISGISKPTPKQVPRPALPASRTSSQLTVCFTGLVKSLFPDTKEGIIKFTKEEKECVAYFLYENVYLTKNRIAKDPNELTVRQQVYLTPVPVSNGFRDTLYAAHCVWIRSKPKNHVPAQVGEHIRMMMVLLGPHAVTTSSVASINSSISCQQPNSNVITSLQGVTAGVWKVLNRNEGLFLMNKKKTSGGSIVWFNRTHFYWPENNQRALKGLLGEIFHLDADLIWAAATSDKYTWYQATIIWPTSTGRPSSKETGIRLDEYNGTSSVTQKLKTGLKIKTDKNFTFSDVDQFFQRILDRHQEPQKPGTESAMESSQTKIEMLSLQNQKKAQLNECHFVGSNLIDAASRSTTDDSADKVPGKKETLRSFKEKDNEKSRPGPEQPVERSKKKLVPFNLENLIRDTVVQNTSLAPTTVNNITTAIRNCIVNNYNEDSVKNYFTSLFQESACLPKRKMINKEAQTTSTGSVIYLNLIPGQANNKLISHFQKT